MKLRSKKGFTLMEMLIVVAIIAILVAIAIPTVSNALEKARIAADEANVRSAYAEGVVQYMLADDEDAEIEDVVAGGITVKFTTNDDGDFVASATSGMQSKKYESGISYCNGVFTVGAASGGGGTT